MSIQVQHRRGTAAANAIFIGAEGELIWLTDEKRWVGHDGATAGGIKMPRLDEIGDDAYREVGNAAVTLQVSDSRVALNASLTAPRVVTLPAANAVPAGKTIRMTDKVAGLNGANIWSLTRVGSDTINGGTTAFSMAVARGQWEIVSDGVSAWWVQDAPMPKSGGTFLGSITAPVVNAVNAGAAGLILRDTTAGANLKNSRILNFAGVTTIDAVNDAQSATTVTFATLNHTTGVVTLGSRPMFGANTPWDSGNLDLTGSVVNCVSASLGTIAATSDVVPLDDTIPQIGEGTLILTAAITPKTTTNKLRVHVHVPYSIAGSAGSAIAGLFRNGVNDALAAVWKYDAVGSGGALAFIHEFVPGVTSSVTLTTRIGVDNASRSLVVNGLAGPSRMLGGAQRAWMFVQEIKA